MQVSGHMSFVPGALRLGQLPEASLEQAGKLSWQLPHHLRPAGHLQRCWLGDLPAATTIIADSYAAAWTEQ